jgi:hypothetical protein
MGKPYVVSEELDLTDAYPARLINNKKINEFRDNLYADLTSLGKNVAAIPAVDIQQPMTRSIEQSLLPVISLDDRYIRLAERQIGISRGVDPALEDTGYAARAGYQAIESQLDLASAAGREVLLADNVIYSGEMILWVADQLQRRGTKVGGVICGIAVKEGVMALEERGIDTQAGFVFDELEDEVCERDFALVPGSGRRVPLMNANALYFDPVYGKPSEWASLPAEESDGFFRRSLERSMNILQPDITMESVGRFVGYGTDKTVQEQIINRLEEQL